MTKNKVVLVTGGSRGLGRDMVLNIAKKNINILFTYHTNEAAAEALIAEVAAMGSKAWALQLDSTNFNSLDNFVTRAINLLEEKNGSNKIDFLVNNAGTALYVPATEATELQMDEMYNIHLKGVFFLTQKMLPHINDGGGMVAFLCSEDSYWINAQRIEVSGGQAI